MESARRDAVDVDLLVRETLDAWREVREGVIAELEAVPDEAIDRPPLEGGRSAAELTRHIVATAEMWSHELAREDGDFTRQGFPEFLREYAGPVETVEGKRGLEKLLRETLEAGASRLAAAAPILRTRPIRAFSGRETSRITWLNHGIAHEMYHRGQLAWCVRAAGVTPALTRRIGG